MTLTHQMYSFDHFGGNIVFYEPPYGSGKTETVEQQFLLSPSLLAPGQDGAQSRVGVTGEEQPQLNTESKAT